MQCQEIRELIESLVRTYGGAYQPWGTSESEAQGTGFVIEGLPVYFSVMSSGDIPTGELDVQVSSKVTVPLSLGYDMYLHEGRYSAAALVKLVEQYRAPIEQWPK